MTTYANSKSQQMLVLTLCLVKIIIHPTTGWQLQKKAMKTGKHLTKCIKHLPKMQKTQVLNCGPMPNLMAALPNIGALSAQRRNVWLTPTTRVPCSNAAKTRSLLKFAWVPQTRQQISAASGPKFTILWRHVEEILLFKNFFSDCQFVP